MTFKPSPWSDSLEHGLIWMDSQHRGLVEMNGRLFHAFMAGETANELTTALDSLHEYVRVHFDLEREYMTAYAYPNSQEHVQEHDKFVDDIARFVQETEALGDVGDDLSIPTLCMQVEQWIVEHIQGSDGDFAEFIREVEGRRWQERSAG